VTGAEIGISLEDMRKLERLLIWLLEVKAPTEDMEATTVMAASRVFISNII
jgi:hypothetical protein